MKSKIIFKITVIIISAVLTSSFKIAKINKTIQKSYRNSIIYSDKGFHEETLYKYIDNSNPIPYKYQYVEVDTDKLNSYLKEQNSILSNEPYFSSILNCAKEHNLNPCLLFAITGREQGFVPQTHPKALKIANNPFNVFGSWQIYNTNITSSTNIACKTIIKLSANRPSDISYLKWINSQNGNGGGYAEDTSWWEGVDKFFKQMTEAIK